MSSHSGGKAIEILLVEDNEGDARLVREILRDRPEIDIHMVDRLSLGVEYLRSHETDVVLLDLGLPDSQGLDSLRTLSGAVPHVPVIVITGQDDEEIGRTAIRQGAQDYLVKPVTPGRMLARILLFAVERKRMEEHEKHLNAVLRSIRAVNKLISREKRRDRLIQTACDRLTDARGINGIWIVLTDRLPGRVEAAQKGFKEEAFSALVDIFRKGGMPPCFRRAQTGSGIIVNRNPPEECEGCPMANAYERAAALSTRIEHEGRYFGCMGFSVPQEYVVDEEEKLLLEEIAEDIAFGLNGIETEAARQKSEQTLRAILDSAADGMLLVEMETRLFVHSNKAISRMLGYSPEEIRGLSIADIHPAEDLPRVLEQFEKQFRGEITVARDIPMKRKDGSVFYADINSAPVELEGRPHLLGIFRDITERKLMEASLRQSEERYRSIFQGAGEGILINEIETMKIKYVNPAMCQMLGYTEDELKRMTVRDIHPDDVVRHAISEFEAHER